MVLIADSAIRRCGLVSVEDSVEDQVGHFGLESLSAGPASTGWGEHVVNQDDAKNHAGHRDQRGVLVNPGSWGWSMRLRLWIARATW
jgi:hypothetical protein